MNFLVSFILLTTLLYCTASAQPNTYCAEPLISKSHYVGELGSSWEFPSDHLPVGLTIGNFHIASWNILHKKYIFQIEKNEQGLCTSSITADNIPALQEGSLTVREGKSVDFIKKMITHSNFPRSLIALQEVSDDVISTLQETLPENWEIIRPIDNFRCQQYFLYDKNIFSYLAHEATQYFPNKPKRIFTLSLKEIATDMTYHFIQTHIPGSEEHLYNSCNVFARNVLDSFDSSSTTVLMGDMNCPANIVQDHLAKISESSALRCQPFKHIPTPYPTSISKELHTESIDNYFIYKPEKYSMTGVHANLPETFPNELQLCVNLLERTESDSE